MKVKRHKVGMKKFGYPGAFHDSKKFFPTWHFPDLTIFSSREFLDRILLSMAGHFPVWTLPWPDTSPTRPFFDRNCPRPNIFLTRHFPDRTSSQVDTYLTFSRKDSWELNISVLTSTLFFPILCICNWSLAVLFMASKST